MMKFWQLASILSWNKQHSLPIETLGIGPEWAEIGNWYENLSEIIRVQDRTKLDYELPDNFVKNVLSRCTQFCYLHSVDNEKWLRSTRFTVDDQTISLLQAYETYGADALEEAFEYGSYDVSTSHSLIN